MCMDGVEKSQQITNAYLHHVFKFKFMSTKLNKVMDMPHVRRTIIPFLFWVRVLYEKFLALICHRSRQRHTIFPTTLIQEIYWRVWYWQKAIPDWYQVPWQPLVYHIVECCICGSGMMFKSVRRVTLIFLPLCAFISTTLAVKTATLPQIKFNYTSMTTSMGNNGHSVTVFWLYYRQTPSIPCIHQSDTVHTNNKKKHWHAYIR